MLLRFFLRECESGNVYLDCTPKIIFFLEHLVEDLKRDESIPYTDARLSKHFDVQNK